MIAIINYEAGNLTSVREALFKLGADVRVTQNPQEILQAERVIIPGVGAAGSAFNSLKRLGLDVVIHQVVARNTPVLGICLGSQIILSSSEENNSPGLNIVPGQVRRLHLENARSPEGWPLKVPHMGWNKIEWQRPHPVFEGLGSQHEFYFVHSYYLDPDNKDVVLGRTSYGHTFASVLAHNNLVAVQFHPEKSGNPGLKILNNFLHWNGQEN